MKIVILLSVILTIGCTKSNFRKSIPLQEEDFTIPHPLVLSSSLQYKSCNYKYFKKLKDIQIKGAVEGYLFSIMSSNTYQDTKDPYYKIPNWQLKERNISDSGLALDIYKHDFKDEYVIAYKGTDFTKLNDWQTNLSFVEPNQYAEAFEHLSKFITSNANSKIYLTGHSLGGGIALNLAQRLENVTAIAFNASPRAFFKRDKNIKNDMLHFQERGEVLGPLNRTWLKVKIPELQVYSYNYLDFLWWTFSPLKEHGMYRFSRALLLSAIYSEDEQAKNLFVANIDEKKAIELEPSICKSIYEASNF